MLLLLLLLWATAAHLHGLGPLLLQLPGVLQVLQVFQVLPLPLLHCCRLLLHYSGLAQLVL